MHYKIVNSILIATLLGLIKLSQETSLGTTQETEKLSKQLVEDLFFLQDDLKKLQVGLDLLNSRLSTETDVIRHVKSHLLHREDILDKCEMNDFITDIDSKLMKIKHKIQQLVNEHDDEHMDKFDKILFNAKKATHDCSSTENEALVELKAQITAKLAQFDKHMEYMQTLEDKLTNPPASDQETSVASSDLTNLLNEINTKLSVQQDKLTELENLTPDVQKAIVSLAEYEENRKITCNKKKCISKKILELTKNAPAIEEEK